MKFSLVASRFRGAVCLVAAGLLSGCLLGKDYVRPELDIPEKFRFDTAEATEMANTRWWEQFEDTVLNDLIRSALENNLDVRIAAARVEEFYGALGATRSGFFPQVGVNGSAARDLIPPSTSASDSFQVGLLAAWEVDLFGRLRRLSEASRADLLASEEGRRFVVLSIVSGVATTYVTLRTIDEQLEIARQTVVSREEALKIFDARYRRGAISEIELSQARSEYANTRATIAPLERQQAQIENALSVLIGRNPGSIERGKKIEELTLPLVPEGLPSEILERRPDLRQAELNLISANARIGAAKALYFPNISLTGLLGSASSAVSDLFTGPAQLWSYGGTITAPIFTAGGVSSQVRIAEARQQQTLFAYQKTIQVAFQEVEDALIANQKSHEGLEAQAERVDALTSYARLAHLRFDNGYSGYLEVLDAERGLFAAQIDYTRAKSDTYIGLINLYKSMGGGWVVEASDMTPPPQVDISKNPTPFP